MKVEVYGKPYSQACQDAVGLLKSAKINVKFYNTDEEVARNKLITITKDLQKEAGYIFKSLDNSPMPVVISNDTKEILVGYDKDDHLYNNILKEAKVKELNDFVKKYPEWQKRK